MPRTGASEAFALSPPERVDFPSTKFRYWTFIRLLGIVTVGLAVIASVVVGVLIAEGVLPAQQRSPSKQTRISYDPIFYGNLHPYLYPEELELFDIQTDTDVIIIGAGIAGLAAAISLKEIGGLDVLVLEARDVPGGRISSAQFANQSVELGSQWLYGSYNNPLSMLAQLFDARMALAHSIPSQESESLSYHASSFPLTATSDINRSSSISQPINVQKYALFEISRTYEKTGERLTGSPSSLFQFEDVTGQMPSVDENFMVDGPNTVSLGELHKIVYGLTDLLNVGTSERTGVLFHAVVASIHLDDLNVTVTLGNGTSYKAQYVISTMPLGVLKEDSINFFPPLPQETYDVIRKLGFQTTNPVHLLFEHPFWIVESEMLTINSEPDDGWKHFLSLYTFLGRPLLVALPGDRASRSMENMTDADVISTVVSILRTEFGTEKVPEPQQAMVTQWGLNPFARGTHSCVTSENSPKDRSTLAEPVRGCMLFAGEAVSIWHPATAHGALFSGIDQARRILSAMELPQGLYDENSECTMECHESSEISFERSTTESIHPASP